jgi:hypothetical protein
MTFKRIIPILFEKFQRIHLNGLIVRLEAEFGINGAQKEAKNLSRKKCL